MIKVICDKCYQDAEVVWHELSPGQLRAVLRCHGRSEYLKMVYGSHPRTNPGEDPKPDVFVWSNLEALFLNERALRDLAGHQEREMLRFAKQLVRHRNALQGQDTPRISVTEEIFSAEEVEHFAELLLAVQDRAYVIKSSLVAYCSPEQRQAMYEALESTATTLASAALDCKPR